MSHYGFMREDQRKMSRPLSFVRVQEDLFMHDVLHEILARYGQAIADLEGENKLLALELERVAEELTMLSEGKGWELGVYAICAESNTVLYLPLQPVATRI